MVSDTADSDAFAELVAPHRRELLVHCYRMLGSADDADDALQETLLAAWRGLPDFEGRSSLRSWLYRIATNCCLRMAEQRKRRVLSWEYGTARSADDDLGEPQPGPWIEPLIDADPQESLLRRESVGLAYVAALQNLPPNQRAVLLLREVLMFSAAETADLLSTSVSSVNSALQRARATLGSDSVDVDPESIEDHVVTRFIDAFERGDVDALVDLLAADVRFTMPPLAAWFDGREDVTSFFESRVFATRWRSLRTVANGQPALACYQEIDGSFRLSALNVLTMTDGRITWIASFLDPRTLARLQLPDVLV